MSYAHCRAYPAPQARVRRRGDIGDKALAAAGTGSRVAAQIPQRLVGYDNEAGKGDHRHYSGREEPYQFTTPERLIADYLADVGRMRRQ